MVLTMRTTTLIFFYQVWLLTRLALMNIMIKAERKRRIQERRERENLRQREVRRELKSKGEISNKITA